MNRRSLLVAVAAASLFRLLPAEAREIADAAAAPPTDLDRIWVRRDDPICPEIDLRFRTAGDRSIDRDALLRLSWFWRDVKDRQQAVWIDPDLFDLLSRLQGAATALAGVRRPVMLLSGYRTPERNRTLEGAARRSMHIFGRASDITLPGYSPAQVAMIAATTGAGGIGLYPRFTHVDTGRLRAWGASGVGRRG